MNTLLLAVVLPVVLGTGGLFYLGDKSQQGAPMGLIDGQLSPGPSSPNCVSSEPGVAGDQRVDALSGESWENLPAQLEAMGGVVYSVEYRCNRSDVSMGTRVC